ncbi:uncharacterized protein NEMAJ01_0573 [Nematocida major]|uniref:uncharacterized protein n=1 Tax=Nematocida major TaxID=1912982 RepID=UPI002008D8BD|nr:uncharacterized protein NEMAJ01_0573 [Nematocida major]KAH9385677.1 hypothetical protein NEMAJ01_0573 [Nematocida major]
MHSPGRTKMATLQSHFSLHSLCAQCEWALHGEIWTFWGCFLQALGGKVLLAVFWGYAWTYMGSRTSARTYSTFCNWGGLCAHSCEIMLVLASIKASSLAEMGAVRVGASASTRYILHFTRFARSYGFCFIPREVLLERLLQGGRNAQSFSLRSFARPHELLPLLRGITALNSSVCRAV